MAEIFLKSVKSAALIFEPSQSGHWADALQLAHRLKNPHFTAKTMSRLIQLNIFKCSRWD
jgi:hypothetical protein